MNPRRQPHPITAPLTLLIWGLACGDGGESARPRAIFNTPMGPLELSYEISHGMARVEGDILLPLPEASSDGEIGVAQSAAAVARERRTAWTKGRVPYRLNGFFLDQSRIFDAMAHWESVSHIRFVPYTEGDTYFLNFTPDPEVCESPVGRFSGGNEIYLASACDRGSIIHEIGHSLGLWHEQSRPDRDDHVLIHSDNILEGKEDNFKIPSGNVQAKGSYDLGSIMHYDSLAFSKDRTTPLYTITLLDGTPFESNRTAASRRDVCAVHRFNGIGTGSDLNNDGIADLVVGVPGETIGTFLNDGGAISVIFGTEDGPGLTSVRLDRNVDGVEDQAADGDQFGASLAFGDFNGDCYGDVAVGVPFDDVNALVDAGSVHVFYGSALGLQLGNDQVWHPGVTGVVGDVQSGARFGTTLASGDFDGDGLDELVIGAPYDEVGGVADAGSVTVLYGSLSGLTATGSVRYTQNTTLGDLAEVNDQFGAALATGDFNGDGREELAIGVPNETLGSQAGAGMVHVLVGGSAGLSTAGNTRWSLAAANAVSVTGGAISPSANDLFGFALATGDFDADGLDDLAVGVPLANVGASVDAGAVITLFGAATGLNNTGAQAWYQGAGGTYGASETSDTYGRSLASGDFNADGYDDLAIGAPYDTINGEPSAGAVGLLVGSYFGLSAQGSNGWYQSASELASSSEAYDRFGHTLRTGDYDGDGIADLLIGVPYEDTEDQADSGVVHLLFGKKAGLSASGSQMHSQATLSGFSHGTGDRFGFGL